VAPDTASLSTASPVYYKKIQVGEVISVTLDKKINSVETEILIYKEYQELINDSTVFWNSSGVTIQVGFNKMQMQMDSLTSLLKGGISFESRNNSPPLDKNKELRLFKTKGEAILSRGSRYTFTFENMEGLNVGAPIRYKEVDIGEIATVELDKDLRSLIAVGYVYEKAEALFNEGTYVWMVTPSIKFSGIENISTAILGPYLTIAPGKGKAKNQFKIHPSPPLQKKYAKGLAITLQAERPDSLSKGSPVYYRQVQVGEVLDLELAQDSRTVNLIVGIEEAYTPLVRSTSEFWNASGIRITGGLMTEMKIATESLQALLSGGIAMAVPEKDIGMPVTSGHVFDLLTTPTEGWQKWRPEIQLSSKNPKEEVTLEATTTTKPKKE